MRFIPIAILAATLACGTVGAQLYTDCIVDGKRKIGFYTEDRKPEGATCRLQESHERVNQPAASTVTETKAAPLTPANAPKASGTKKTSAPISYPVVSATLQKQRDKKRGKILLFELQREKQRIEILNTEINKIKQSEQTASNTLLLSHFEKQLHTHSQNVKAIQQELARL